MKRILLILLIIMAGSYANAASIKIATEGAYEPFNYTDAKGNLKGFDIDIAKELCKEIKVDCKFVKQAWDGIIPGLLYKKYDAIVASMSITKERAKKVLFSDSYYRSPARFMVPNNSKFKFTKEWLKGKKIGVQRGTTHVRYLEGEWSGVLQIQEYDTQENANMDLVAGRVDAIMADSTVLYDWMKKFGKDRFTFKGPSLNEPKYFGLGAGIAFRKKDKILAEKFNQAIAQIKKDGRYDTIRKRYFPFDIK